MKIIIDTREQTPYQFATITPPPEVTRATLKTGDYSIEGFEDQVTIERKSLQDAFGTIGKGRRRFIRELERMSEYDAFGTIGKGRRRFIRELERMSSYNFAAVVIEADWNTIIRNPPTRSKLNPKSVYSSILAWMQRYGVHFVMAPNRAFAEKTTYRLLERYLKDHANEERP